MIKSINHSVSKLAITIMIGGISLAHPAYAHDGARDQKSSAVSRHHNEMDHVEQRIRTMHDKLNVTAEQEPQWAAVAKIMRNNESDIHKLVQGRHENEPANAVDDLKSYEIIADAHAEGLKKLVPAFETFYNTLSDKQKTKADSMFGRFEGRSAPKASSLRSPNNQE